MMMGNNDTQACDSNVNRPDNDYNWVAPCVNVCLVICGQRRPSLGCTTTQSDQGLHYPLTKSLQNV